MKVTRKKLKEIILKSANKGRIFNVSFLKVDGTVRHMHCRLKQFDQYVGGERTWNPEEVNKLFVIDIEKVEENKIKEQLGEKTRTANRTINFDTILSAKVDGQKFITQ